VQSTVAPVRSEWARGGSLAAAIAPSSQELTRARRRLHWHALLIVALVAGSYWMLVVATTSVLVKILSAAVLVIGLTATATQVFHDGNHASFSTSRLVNRLAAYTGDLLGGSSWVWRFKHNNLHHGNTNIGGVDSDIEQSPFARLTREQPWHPWHRYQHLYMWVLYGFVTLRWLLIDDFTDLHNRGIGGHDFPTHPRRRDVASIFCGKLIHVGWAIALPLVFHSWWVVLVFYVAISWTVGLLLATMFQLAHCTELVGFPAAEQSRRGDDFAAHQLCTTADVDCRTAQGRSAVHWLMGGLDYQVEHHLAPRLPHTVYPLVARRLRGACAEQGLHVISHDSVWQAVRSHGRWLKRMGVRP
jgi:linoleoyl-CoA desaturase